MKNGSHSRHTYPYDKSLPVELAHQTAGHPAQKQTMKKLQKRKARQHTKLVCKEVE